MIPEFLKNNKTYLVASIAVLSGLIIMVDGNFTKESIIAGLNAVLIGLASAALRSTLGKTQEKLDNIEKKPPDVVVLPQSLAAEKVAKEVKQMLDANQQTLNQGP